MPSYTTFPEGITEGLSKVPPCVPCDPGRTRGVVSSTSLSESESGSGAS